MTPTDPLQTPAPLPDPAEPDFAMPAEGEAAVAPVTHEVDADDMFDPLSG